MSMSTGSEELYNALLSAVNEDGCAENLKRIVEARCMLPLSKAYVYVRNFKDVSITRDRNKHGRPLVIKFNREA